MDTMTSPGEFVFGRGRLFSTVDGREVEIGSVSDMTVALTCAPMDGGRVEISRDEYGSFRSIWADWVWDYGFEPADIEPDPLPPPRGRAALLGSASIRPADIPTGPRSGWYGASDAIDRFAHVLRQVSRNVGKTALAEKIERERLRAGRRSDSLPIVVCPA